MEKEKLCLRCMRKIGDNDFCPYCRKENSEPQKEPFLPLKTVVGGRYIVGNVAVLALSCVAIANVVCALLRRIPGVSFLLCDFEVRSGGL
jgi:hypothetical protein